MEAYIDDILVKSMILSNISKICKRSSLFYNNTRWNLNPTKCAFNMKGGEFPYK